MTNWKDHERACAALIGGSRYAANSGGRIDVESDRILGQVKERQELSLAEQVRLVLEVETIAKSKGKVGVLFVRHKAGRGNPSPGLVVMTHEAYATLMLMRARDVAASLHGGTT